MFIIEEIAKENIFLNITDFIDTKNIFILSLVTKVFHEKISSKKFFDQKITKYLKKKNLDEALVLSNFSYYKRFNSWNLQEIIKEYAIIENFKKAEEIAKKLPDNTNAKDWALGEIAEAYARQEKINKATQTANKITSPTIKHTILGTIKKINETKKINFEEHVEKSTATAEKSPKSSLIINNEPPPHTDSYNKYTALTLKNFALYKKALELGNISIEEIKKQDSTELSHKMQNLALKYAYHENHFSQALIITDDIPDEKIKKNTFQVIYIHQQNFNPQENPKNILQESSDENIIQAVSFYIEKISIQNINASGQDITKLLKIFTAATNTANAIKDPKTKNEKITKISEHIGKHSLLFLQSDKHKALQIAEKIPDQNIKKEVLDYIKSKTPFCHKAIVLFTSIIISLVITAFIFYGLFILVRKNNILKKIKFINFIKNSPSSCKIMIVSIPSICSLITTSFCSNYLIKKTFLSI
ncbi:MAG: hypothetical protein AMS24_01690 [Chlamydiae bacterium SM23_39]|nr:MAG: hypothetical protein AMS24_01690 [Chlamydiae bacterium SM23_39]